ncbi:MAG TPA: hypothetical protein VGH36_02080, partial [Acetobacteraceae bacterium]
MRLVLADQDDDDAGGGVGDLDLFRITGHDGDESGILPLTEAWNEAVIACLFSSGIGRLRRYASSSSPGGNWNNPSECRMSKVSAPGGNVATLSA